MAKRVWPEMLNRVLFHLLTDRFRSKNYPYSVDQTNPLGWFGGNYQGILQSQEEGFFDALEVDTLQPSPPYGQSGRVFDEAAMRFDDSAHCYWPSDLMSINERFGPVNAFRSSMHEGGKKVIWDMVHHLGSTETALCKERPELFTSPRTWYWDLPLLNLGREDVRNYVFQSLRFWNPDGKDFFRWDSLHHLPDDYIRFLFGADDSPAKDIWSVGEVLDGDPLVLKKFLDLGVPAVYNQPLFYCFSEELSSPNGNMQKVAEVFAAMFNHLEIHPSRLVNFCENHDMTLLRTESLDRGCSPQEATDRLKMAIALTFYLPGIPSIYYTSAKAWCGKNFGDPNRSGRPMLDWGDYGQLYPYIALVSEARKSNAILCHGDYREFWRPSQDFPESVLCFARTLAGATPIVIVINNGDTPLELSIPVSILEDTNALSDVIGQQQDFIVRDGLLLGTISARTVLVLTMP
jgi:neopullulanase